MNDHELESIERQLASIQPAPAPLDLRQTVLTGVNRQLRADRRDRVLGRAAAILLVLGIGLNAGLGIAAGHAGNGQATARVKFDAVAQSALAVADATDAETAVQFARRLAILGGAPLSPDEDAAIQRQIKSHFSTNTRLRGDG